jgi:hypothetical protein
MPFIFQLPLSARRIAALTICLCVGLSLTAAAVVRLPMRSAGPLYPLRGQLFVADVPAAGAEICFYERRDDGTASLVAWAKPKADGSFEAITGLTQRGIRPGRYAVTVTWRAPVISGEDYLPGPNIVPSRYASPDTTPLSVQANPQDNQLSPWSLPARDCGG